MSALAMTVGLGMAIATGHGVATASPDGGGSSSKTESSSSDSGATSSDASGSSAGSRPSSGSVAKSPDAPERSTTTGADDSPTTDSGSKDADTEDTDKADNEKDAETAPVAPPETTAPEDAPEAADSAAGSDDLPAPEPADSVDATQLRIDSDTEASPTPDTRSITPPTAAFSADSNTTPAARAALPTPEVADIATSSITTTVPAPAAASEAVAPAPVGPIESLVTGFLSLVTAPFLLSGGTGGPAGPLGPLLELFFVAQRRVQAFFFNQPPTARPVQTAPAAEKAVTGTVVAVDPEGDTLTYTIVRQPTSGSVTINGAGEYVYTPNAAFALTGGTDSFGVVVDDNSLSLRTIVRNVLSVFGAPAESFGTPVTVSVDVLPASPPPTGPLVFAVTTTGQLVSFTPAAPQTILSSRTITGLSAGETVLGIDYRPANGKLYALTSGGKLYVVDESTGAVTLASALTADPTDPTAPFSALPGGSTFGIDFNPVPDRLRVVEDVANLRINVDTGAATTDSDLAPTGDYFAAAYTNSFPMPPNTALYVLDAAANTLVSIGSVPAVAGACPGATGNPNCGVATVIGQLGVDAGNVGGFDIAGPANDLVLAAFQTGDSGRSSLYRIDLATGAATLVGGIGTGASAPVITGLAIRAS